MVSTNGIRSTKSPDVYVSGCLRCPNHIRLLTFKQVLGTLWFYLVYSRSFLGNVSFGITIALGELNL